MTDTDTDLQSVISALLRQAVIADPRQRPPSWSADEIAFLHKNAGILDDQQIGEALGRTANAVKIFRVRAKLKAVSRAGTVWITANQAARVLGVDSHKMTYWCRVGLVPARFRVHAESQREYILINRELLKRWCVNLRNWVYIDWRRIKDERIRRLCELRAERWGDEWWDTTQVASHHGVDVTDVKRLISRGEINSYRPEYSLGGRNLRDTWRNHFVLKSEATRADLVFHKRQGAPGKSRKFSPGFDAFLFRARAAGYEWAAIAKMSKVAMKSCMYRYSKLLKARAQ
jgi:hypothetical protein